MWPFKKMNKDMEKTLELQELWMDEVIKKFDMVIKRIEENEKRLIELEKRPTIEDIAKDFRRRGFEMILNKEVNQ